MIVFRVISHCIQLLVQDLETACDSALTAMTKVDDLKIFFFIIDT